MSWEEKITQIFKGWGRDLNEAEKSALANKARGYLLSDWKREHIAMATGSGVVTGLIGGPVGAAAIIPDLLWCKKVGTQGCLGIGHIKGKHIDYEQDMNLILSIWSKLGEASFSIPAGKVGIKISHKLGPKVLGKVVEKSLFKGSTKLGAKMTAKVAAKATAKLATKLSVKVGLGWIPLVGGLASGGVNLWLISGLLDAAEEYYNSDYVVLSDNSVLV